MRKIWDKRAVINDAFKYQTVGQWRKHSASAYAICCRNKWNDAACAHMTMVKRPNGYWTKKRIIAESRKYKTVGEWRRGNSGSYVIAKRTHAVPDNMRRELIHGQWTKKKIQEIANTCETRGEFRVTHPSAYTIAATKNWLDDVCHHMLDKAPWFGPRIIREFLLSHDIPHHLEYKFKGSPDVARFPFDFYLPTFNLVVEYHGRQHRFGWMNNPGDAKEIQIRDKVKRDFAKREGINFLEIDATTKESVIERLLTELKAISGRRKQVLHLVKRKLTSEEKKKLNTAFLWNEDTLLEAIAKCETVKEFREIYPSGYAYGLTTGLWAEASKNLKRLKEHGKYTKSYVTEMAKQCATPTEFRTKYLGCWDAARRNGWMAEVCKDMLRQAPTS